MLLMQTKLSNVLKIPTCFQKNFVSYFVRKKNFRTFELPSLGDAASQVYKRLANLLCDKLDLSYGEVNSRIRCKLSFALVRSAIMCIRGARSRLHVPIYEAPVDVQIAEARL